MSATCSTAASMPPSSLSPPPPWSLPSAFGIPGTQRVATSDHPLLLGASPGTTGTMSLYFALVALGVSSVHYTRHFNASTQQEITTYADGGGPVPLIRPLFRDTGSPPPVDVLAARRLDLRFLEGTDALLDTPTMEVFYDALATFPKAKVLITAREPLAWAESRRTRHPSDMAPLFPLLGFEAPMAALTAEQAARALALWYRAVSASVPPERLLVLDVFNMSDEELWAKLSNFVEKPLPERDPNTGLLPPFPHQRYGEDVWQ